MAPALPPFRAGATALAAVLLLAPVHAAERPYVLDRDDPSVTAIEPTGGAAAGRLPLTGRPEAMVRTPDRATLLVFDEGPGKDKGEAGYQASGRSSVTIVDAASLTVRGRVELGSGLLGRDVPAGILSPDGRRLALVCPGHESKTPSEALPRELVTVDVAKGVESGRLTLERAVSDLSSDREAKTAFLFSPRRGRGDDALPARLTVVDLEGPTVVAAIDLKGDPRPPMVSPDGRHLYLLDPGSPNEAPDKHVDGTLQVVSIADRKVAATLAGGSGPRQLTVDHRTGLSFFLNDGAAARGLDAGYGELRVVKGAALATVVRTAPAARFLRISPAGDRMYVVGPQAVDIVELPALRSHPMHLDRAKGAIFEDDPGPARELALSPDGKRAFVLYERTGRLLVLDLEKEDSVAMVALSRGGLGVLKPLGLAREPAPVDESPRGLFRYDAYRASLPLAPLVVRDDSQVAYVATPSHDVVVVKAGEGTVERKVAGGRGLRMFPGGARLAAVADDALRLIDVRAGTSAAEVRLPKLRAVVPAPDERGVFAVTDTEIVRLDSATGDVTGRVGGFRRAVQIVFAAASTP